MTHQNHIRTLEREIEEKYERLSELRAKVSPQKISDYTFIASDGNRVTLAELFGTADRLIMVHNMGRQCPYCTIWADGFSDSYHRISEKVPFIVTSKETVDVQQKNIEERGWTFPMVSSGDNQFLEDMGFLAGGSIYPGLGFFCKNEDGENFYHGKHVFGSGAQYGMLRHIFDFAGVWDPADYEV